MLLSQVHTISTSPFPFTPNKKSNTLLPKSLIPSLESESAVSLHRSLLFRKRTNFKIPLTSNAISASLIESPVIWAGRVCIFYALLKAGLAGSPNNRIVADSENSDDGEDGEDGDLGFYKWLGSIKGKPVNEAAERRKLVSKWHPTTKGTLRRNYRIPSKTEGKRLLKAIASLLSDDDHFLDATSHKGCQIRRESAHGESVCCNNVRALFDELPTPHIIIEITPFPAGPLSDRDYIKAEKLEKVLRSSPSI